jgi:hypothetical protein
MAEFDKPAADDLRSEDAEFNPGVEPQSSKAWLNLLKESEEAFEEWNFHCDRIEKNLASIIRLAADEPARTKEYQMFWANTEVLKPSIYAKPPVPVVAPKFKDRRPVYQQASELLERCCIVAFDLTRINDLMLLVRDDLSTLSRGVAWCRYESGKDDGAYYDSERVCIDFKGRRDFLHSISRNWREVTWVAAASYLTRTEARERFKKHSGDAYQEAEYRVDKDSEAIGGADKRERAKFWEIWSKGDRRVVWVSEGCDDILDEDDPHLDLQNFFPCPKPAYGVVQPGSLIPVPDALQYRDQLQEINLLTAKIHALSDELVARGFYPAGGSELSEAIQTAVKSHTPGQLLVPIANWASFGGTKDVIIWWPIEQIVTTIQGCVLLRKQVIDDIYQLTGLADIMRGDTDPNETLGAQQLKTQYGTTRIRDKQQELVRFARDLVEITSEIMTEKFEDATLVEMSQTQLPMQRDVEQQITQIVQRMQVEQAQGAQMLQQPQQPQQPQDSSQPGQDPRQQALQMMQQRQQQAQMEIYQLQQQPTIEQVLRFLKDNRAKSFVLDIETDSTIMADENAEKAARNEFAQVLGNLLPQIAQLIQADPQNATFAGDILKFFTAPYRVGRSLDSSIDELAERYKAKGDQGQADDPQTAMGKIQLQIEQMKDNTARQKIAAETQVQMAKLQQDSQHKQWELANDRQIAQMKVSSQLGDQQAEMQRTQAQMVHEQNSAQMDLAKGQQQMELERQKADMLMAQHTAKQADFASRANERRQAQQFKMTQPPRQGGPV